MFGLKKIEFNKRDGKFSLILWGVLDHDNNDKKIVKIFKLLMDNCQIELNFDLVKKELHLFDDIIAINGITVIQTSKKEYKWGYRFIIKVDINSDGLLEFLKLIAIHDIGVDFKCMSDEVYGAINDNDGSFIHLSKTIFNNNKENIENIMNE